MSSLKGRGWEAWRISWQREEGEDRTEKNKDPKVLSRSCFGQGGQVTARATEFAGGT